MGGIISSPTASPESVFQAKYLSAKDSALLVDCWKKIEDTGSTDTFATDMGKIIFVNLFNKFPTLLPMFEHFGEDPNWITNRKFLHHCKIFMNVVGSYIKLLNRPEELSHHVQFLGSQHLFFRINREHFALARVEFIAAVDLSFSKEELTPDLREAWIHLYDMLADMMLKAMGSLADGIA